MGLTLWYPYLASGSLPVPEVINESVTYRNNRTSGVLPAVPARSSCLRSRTVFTSPPVASPPHLSPVVRIRDALRPDDCGEDELI
ncbi:hypothetical protein ACWDKQ_20020 [Saccharopolyspora sp. NPDC000995]